MIVHHPGGLHVGVADRCSKKFKAAFLHILADGIGDGGAGRQFVTMIDDGLAIGHKTVEVFIK